LIFTRSLSVLDLSLPAEGFYFKYQRPEPRRPISEGKMMTKQARSWSLREALFCGLLVYSLSPGYAFSQAPFYQGKTITMVAATAPGGSGDMRLRAAMPFLQKHIPGKPAIIVEYMPGGGGRKAANFVYRSVRPDGLTIGSMSSGLVPAAVLGETGVLYDLDKLIYLGSANTGVISVFLTRREAGLDSVDKLRSPPGLRIGAQSVGHIIYTEGVSLLIFLASRSRDSSRATQVLRSTWPWAVAKSMPG
jgi:hypothetical protein